MPAPAAAHEFVSVTFLDFDNGDPITDLNVQIEWFDGIDWVPVQVTNYGGGIYGADIPDGFADWRVSFEEGEWFPFAPLDNPHAEELPTDWFTWWLDD